jgi:hypothetical protein
MRKIITRSIWKITALAMLITCTVAIKLRAQETRTGIKAGLNLAYLRVDGANENNLLPGFHLGLWSDFEVNSTLSFQPEILYNVKGTRSVFDEEILGFSIVDGTTKLGMHYIDIPLYLKLNLSEEFNIHIGPYIGFLMFARAETDTEILEFINVDESRDINRDEFNKLDAGISGGIGFSMDPLIFGINYNLGLRQVAKDGQPMHLLLGDAAHTNMQLYVGITFPTRQYRSPGF